MRARFYANAARYCAILCAIMLAMPIYAATNLEDIEKDITTNRQKLEAKTKEEKQISSHLSSLGNTINARKKQIEQLRAQTILLQKSISQNQSQSQNQEKKLLALRQNLQSLEQEKNAIQNYIANIIIKDLSFFLVLDKHSVVSPDDVMIEEIFDVLTKQSQRKIVSLNERQKKITTQIGLITNNINEITILISTQQGKKEQLQQMIAEQNRLGDKLQTELKDYNQRLIQITKEREGLDSILQNLNIIKADRQKEIERQRQALIAAQKAQQEQEARRKEEASKADPQGETKLAGIESAGSGVSVDSASGMLEFEAPHVVRVSGYKNVAIIKYTGAKTIAPLDYYTIDQNFGPYHDPVYNLKVFNESITLLSKVPNAVVYNIFDGKVVYAKEAPVLKKVVIVEHGNETYTIYSQLDKIAPTVKPGFIVKKGYTIGRVAQKLGLEITQKDRHVNPMDVIASSK